MKDFNKTQSPENSSQDANPWEMTSAEQAEMARIQAERQKADSKRELHSVAYQNEKDIRRNLINREQQFRKFDADSVKNHNTIGMHDRISSGKTLAEALNDYRSTSEYKMRSEMEELHTERKQQFNLVSAQMAYKEDMDSFNNRKPMRKLFDFVKSGFNKNKVMDKYLERSKNIAEAHGIDFENEVASGPQYRMWTLDGNETVGGAFDAADHAGAEAKEWHNRKIDGFKQNLNVAASRKIDNDKNDFSERGADAKSNDGIAIAKSIRRHQKKTQQ